MDQEKNKKCSNKKIIITIGIVSMIIVIALIITFFYINVIIPSNKLEQINELYTQKNYEGVLNQEKELESIKKFLNDEKAFDEVKEKFAISKVFNYYNNQKYSETLNALNDLDNKDSELLNIENDCKYIIAKEKIANKEFTDALELLMSVENKDDLNDLKDTAHFGLAEDYSKNNNNTKVLEELELVENKSIEGYIDLKNKANYEIGKQLFNKKEFDKAIEKFDLCIEYEDANEYKIKCLMGKAEVLIKDSRFEEAMQMYEAIPNEIEYNGINSTTRKNQLNFYISNKNSVGEWKSTKEYIESKNIYKRNGSWDNWYINEPSDSTKLTVELVFNNDGTMSLKANASFYAFNNFSSLQSLCNAKMTYKSTEIKNVTSMPNTIKLDDYTTLTRSGNTYTLKYSKRDEYSISFYNMYNSTITFGNKIK